MITNLNLLDRKGRNTATPFLRWAGGKGWITPYLDVLLPKSFNDYHEVFLGGGAVFFNIPSNHNSFLSDLNEELVITYNELKENVDEVINELKKLKNNKNSFYKIRKQKPKSNLDVAVRFIYLNKTSFNGIYRVNGEGEYNVPYGYRKNIDIVNQDNLKAVSHKLKNTTIRTLDFTSALKNVKRGDLVFLDPPYTVAHEHNGFIQYNQKLFSLDDQKKLSEAVQEVATKGAYYILTNAKHEVIKKIYGPLPAPISLSRSSTVGGFGAKRGKMREYLFTNIKNENNGTI